MKITRTNLLLDFPDNRYNLRFAALFETCRKLRVTKYRISSSSAFEGDPIGSWHALPAAPQLSLFSCRPPYTRPGFLPERSAFTTQNGAFSPLYMHAHRIQNACIFVAAYLRTLSRSCILDEVGAPLRNVEARKNEQTLLLYSWMRRIRLLPLTNFQNVF